MTNNSIFTRVLALMICLVMLVGTLTACFNEVNGENHTGTTTNGEVTTKPTTTTTTTGDVVEDEPTEDPVDPNVIFSASTNISSDSLIYGTLANDVVIGGTEVGALVPADVKVEAGASSLALSVKKVDEELLGDALSALDVHINGVALDNTVPMIVKLGAILEAGLGATELKLYHTENGVDNLMTRVNSPADFAIHNQYYYNAETGEVTIYVASFSVISAVKSVADVWDGSSDTSWYNENDTEFTLTTAEQLAGFRDLVDAGNTFEGKTVTLATDIDLDKKPFDPIGFGYYKDDKRVEENEVLVSDTNTVFLGTFDGGNHTIYNLYENCWELDPNPGVYDTYTYSTAGAGLFASVKDATIKNIAINGAEVVFECVDMGVLVGYAQGECHFENIVISNAKIANYNRYTGGLVGEVSYGVDNNKDGYTHTFKNITIDSTVTVSGLWGSFGCGMGGVIGGKWGTAIVLMENVVSAPVMDVYNDVVSAYQWYAFRGCGMLIGHTEEPYSDGRTSGIATANFLTCENVKVYYGDWVNYTYYQFANQDSGTGRSYPWVRAEAGEYCDAFSNIRYGVPTHNGVKVSDLTAEELKAVATDFTPIIFNQLYGADRGMYGQAEHEGVTVINKNTKTIYIENNLGWENLKLHYWYKHGDDTWTNHDADGIDMSKMLVEGNIYKVDIPAYAYAFVITADGDNSTEEFVLADLEDGADVYLGCSHESTTTVVENEVGATCTSNGSYDKVTKCADCGEEIKRETITTDKLSHTAGETVVENNVASSCTATGSYDNVVYCSVCNAEISRETITTEKLDHTFVDNKCKCGAIRIVNIETVITNTEIDFNLGANGSASHSDSNSAKTTYTETVSGYILNLTNGSAMYPGSRDSKGNSAIKLGTSDKTGGFTFTVPDDVTSVIIYIAKYKANTSKVTINGTSYTLTKNSDNGEYDEIIVDTKTTKTVTVTTVSGGVRAMVNTITFVVTTENKIEKEIIIEDHECNQDITVEGKDATCTDAGLTVGATCSICGQISKAQEVIKANGHTEVIDEAVSATCTETGLTEGKHCSVCNEVLVAQEEVSALGHSDKGNNPYICANGCGTVTLPEAGEITVEQLGWIIETLENAEETLNKYTITGVINDDNNPSSTNGETYITVGNYNIHITQLQNASGNKKYGDFTVQYKHGDTIIVSAKIAKNSKGEVQLHETRIANHIDNPVDHNCDICGEEKITSHIDNDGDLKCDNGCDVLFEAGSNEKTVSMFIYANQGSLANKVITWTNGDVTVSNAQSSSTSAIRNEDSDHHRVYAKSIFKVEANKITKIVITCTSNDYATACKNSFANADGCTATASGLVVTITFASPVDSVEVTASAQFRLNKIEVTYTTSGGDNPACQHTNTTETTVDATCTKAGSTTVTCDDCDTVISTNEVSATGVHTYNDSGVCTGCGAEDPNAGGNAPVVDTLAEFTFGTNGNASHSDGSEKTSYTETNNGYTLTLSGMSKVYGSARDAKGNSALKLGTGSAVGKFSFTVPENVTEVVIYIAKYKTNTSKVTINGTSYTLTKNSDNGEYDVITIDTTTTKTITLTTVSGGYRAMINTIVFKGTAK